MSGFPIVLIAAGLLGTLLLAAFAFAGPNANRLQSKRLEAVRERHSRSTEVAAQAQLKRILSNRQTNRVDGFAQRFIPKPALLRKRLEQTGRSWTLGQYMLACIGLVVVTTLGLFVKGLPLLLALML